VPPSKTNRRDDSHEQRLQRLEDSVSDLKSSHAEVSTNLQNLGVQVELGARSIADKIDSVFVPLSTTLHEHIKEDAVTKNQLETIATVVGQIEGERTEKRHRWQSWKTAFYAVVTGAAAIALKELIVYLIHFHV